MYLLSLVFILAGIWCLVRYKQLSLKLAKFYSLKLQEKFSGHDLDRSRYLIVYKAGIIFLGIFLLIMGFHFAFGTIYLGSVQLGG